MKSETYMDLQQKNEASLMWLNDILNRYVRVPLFLNLTIGLR